MAKTQTQYDDGPAQVMIYPALVFMVLGMTFGTFIAFNAFVFPDYFSGEYIHFGKIRPIHVGSVALLWLLSVDVGLFYYFIPRLCGVRLWSPKLAYVSAVLWWISLVIGVHSYPWSTNFGWEYAELPNWVGWIPTKAGFTLAWVLVVVNMFATVAIRKYKPMYVSIWYMMGTMIWTTFTWLAGTVGVNLVPEGISRVNVSFFYVHNLVGLIFTPMGLSAVYYFLPKITNRPIYSHRLSMIGFWSIAFVYAWVGAHHILHGPTSQWLQTVSIIFSIWLFIPVWTVVTNLFGTLAHDWKHYTQSVPVRFLMMGTVFYLLTCIQGPMMALRNVAEITSKTDWVIGHAHVALYASFTFFAIAGVYQAVPTMTGKPLWSKKLANWHFGLNMLGSVPFILSLWIGGYLQGMQWATWADGSTYAQFHSHLTQLTFLDTVADMYPWWVLRAIGGLIVLVANILFVVNMYNTIVLKPQRGERESTSELKELGESA